MNKKPILQKIIENTTQELPNDFLLSDLEQFGTNWNLFDYQVQAIENTVKLLYLYFTEKTKEELYGLYKKEGLEDKFERENLWVSRENSNFELLSQYFPPDPDRAYIPFKEQLNRASFWMATGSGKTLVMVKLIEVLHKLMQSNAIPRKDILVLAPKDDILKQIKHHIDIYNKRKDLYIEFNDLKEWEKIRSQTLFYEKNYVRIFYYRADNITDENKDKQIDYKTFYNNGEWYVILDEAHKGEKATSKRQQYFSILSSKGFLFNFSATFTDSIDIITTLFDFKLDKYLEKGYGKKIYVSGDQFKNFKPRKQNREIINEFNEDERKNIIVETMILLAVAKKHYQNIKKLNKNYYHPPLLVTVANTVNTDDADLKIFYQLLSEIAKREFRFYEVRQKVIESLEQDKNYVIKSLGKIEDNLIDDVKKLTEDEFYESIFNTNKKGTIEVVKFKGNTRELAFRIKGVSERFGLIYASKIEEWRDDVLEGYEIFDSVESGLFNEIDKKKGEGINILLGSRIFTEGWDSNRPNIINFINIGVDEEAKKFVLQTIGRGLRIEPEKGVRKRFDFIDKSGIPEEQTKTIHQNISALESLFVFATKKEVIKNIIEDLEKQSEQWVRIEGVKKNPKINEKEIPLYIPEFEEKKVNDEPFKINRNDKNRLDDYINLLDDKLLVLNDNIKIRTLKKLGDANSFSIAGREKNYKPAFLVKNMNSFWNKLSEQLTGFKILENEINHYQLIETDLIDEIERLENEIKTVLNPVKYTEEEIDELFDKAEINLDEYKKLIKQISRTVENSDLDDYKVFDEHYYIPLLLKDKHFKHVVKVISEIEFVKELERYIKEGNNRLKQYDWWYFSKIDESVDKINIPYFDTGIGEYRNFCPDFIFWLKKDGKYYLKFIDPKGIEHTQNPCDKARGFEKVKKELAGIENKNITDIELYFFSDEIPDSECKEYWVGDFNTIFNEEK